MSAAEGSPEGRVEASSWERRRKRGARSSRPSGQFGLFPQWATRGLHLLFVQCTFSPPQRSSCSRPRYGNDGLLSTIRSQQLECTNHRFNAPSMPHQLCTTHALHGTGEPSILRGALPTFNPALHDTASASPNCLPQAYITLSSQYHLCTAKCPFLLVLCRKHMYLATLCEAASFLYGQLKSSLYLYL